MQHIHHEQVAARLHTHARTHTFVCVFTYTCKLAEYWFSHAPTLLPSLPISLSVSVQALRDSGNDVVEAIMKVRANLR